jgi:hypothetical protein
MEVPFVVGVFGYSGVGIVMGIAIFLFFMALRQTLRALSWIVWRIRMCRKHNIPHTITFERLFPVFIDRFWDFDLMHPWWNSGCGTWSGIFSYTINYPVDKDSHK